jgi:phenylpyruvate tautomerase PptA (4-oxalocrotonate tautomerase family)
LDDPDGDQGQPARQENGRTNLPFIRITVFAPPLTADQIRRLQEGTTALMTSGMRKPLGGTAVLVEQVDCGGWSIAGAPVKVAAHVDAVIGVGTNSPAEKAQFMGGMMDLLRSALGADLREETYVVIHEMDTGSYGRGGLTRAERDRRLEAAPA